MKRTNIVLDEDLLEEATRISGEKTYSATVNLALRELIRLRKIQGLPEFFGSGIWEGDLAEMRGDARSGAAQAGGR
jgi:Arc/MetJ family transcription regulator